MMMTLTPDVVRKAGLNQVTRIIKNTIVLNMWLLADYNSSSFFGVPHITELDRYSLEKIVQQGYNCKRDIPIVIDPYTICFALVKLPEEEHEGLVGALAPFEKVITNSFLAWDLEAQKFDDIIMANFGISLEDAKKRVQDFFFEKELEQQNSSLEPQE